ncbi:uncharacterized protein LOC131036901 [Cryptomeria japonica]|uniref:uncharacterized protein LOC131036901 n=1 Tax=Cryptomeria japonica TaxID=3369 RepID=UPI0025AD3BC2|nr:uncharacterized protein LOC131036901 [Cryptomeria japonica]
MKCILIVYVLSLLCLNLQKANIAEAKKVVHIPDELDDVVDDEEDEEWKEWGKPKPKIQPFDPPPDFNGMDPSQIQAEMLKRHSGPSIGFVKLRLDVPRMKEEVTGIAKKWTQLLRTGSIEAKFMAVDVNTVMFTMEQGQDTAELKDFVLSQPEAYEFKLGQHAYRRPGDPPLEEVIERLRTNNVEAAEGDPAKQSNPKDEL